MEGSTLAILSCALQVSCKIGLDNVVILVAINKWGFWYLAISVVG
jgi:hypothetical protein